MKESGENRPSLPVRVIDSTKKVIKDNPLVLAGIAGTGAFGTFTGMDLYSHDFFSLALDGGLTYVSAQFSAKNIKKALTDGNETDEDQNEESSTKKMANFLRSHKLANYPFDFLTRLYFYHVVKDPEMRAIFTDKEYTTGLLEGSIFSHRLILPDEEEGDFFSYEPEGPGHWAAWDLNRFAEFGEVVEERETDFVEGRLQSAPLFEIIDNDINELTPIALMNWLKFEHMMLVEHSTIEQLIEYGFIRETTYQEAYQDEDWYIKNKEKFQKMQTKGEKLYAVTPKGNGLIYLFKESGENDEEKKDEKKAATVFNPRWIPTPA